MAKKGVKSGVTYLTTALLSNCHSGPNCGCTSRTTCIYFLPTCSLWKLKVMGKLFWQNIQSLMGIIVSFLNNTSVSVHLTGTKYGCGIGGCGACTVMISTYNPETKKIHHYPANSCLLPLCSIHGAAITTVEGVGTTKTKLNPIQERLAKCFGSQCGFCTPGMVMSMYSLLRNHPEPSMEQIVASLDGNLCRCTGYRPILDSFSAFSMVRKQWMINALIFLKVPINGRKCCSIENSMYSLHQCCLSSQRMAEETRGKTLVFNGKRTTWISPSSLKELLQLKATYPQAPLIKPHLSHSILIGAATRFAQLRDLLLSIVSELPMEKTKIYCTLLKQLRTLAGEQIRSLASLGGHIVSRGSTWDLNPVLAAGKAILYLASEGKYKIPLNDEFLERMPQADLFKNEVVVSVFIPFSKENEFISAFRQADRRRNALSVTNSAMKVLFQSGTDVIQDLTILYGGIDCTTVSARNSCQKLIGRNWNEQMLNEACQLILEEITLSPSAPGGKVEYRRTMLISFFFRFYLKVLHDLKNMFPDNYPNLPKECMNALGEFCDTPPKGMQDIDPQQPPQDPVGRPIKHESGIKHATGEAVYVDDMEPAEGQLYMAVVTSTRAHAKILAIDLSEALKQPGVVDVVTARDIPGKNGDGKEDVFANDEVIFIGHIICGVVATSFECAKQAAKKVKIDYQDLEVILTIEEAINHDSFLAKDKKIERGDVEKAFQTVDKIIEGEVHIGGQEHFYLETSSVCVIPRKEDNTMDIYVSTQDAKYVQIESPYIELELYFNKIMCHTKRVGGAFGGKTTKPPFFAAAAAVAAKKTGCPVRFILERQDDMLIVGGRHPLYGKYKVGFMKDGKIKAVDLLIFINGGCTPDESEMVIEYVVLKSFNAYDIPNFRSQGWACKTNLPSNTSFRGFGFAQSALSVEMWIAAVADCLDLPPDKVREMNLYKTISETPYKEKVDARNLLACWKECLKKSDYYIRKEAAEEFNKQNYWKKKGIAIIPMLFSVGYNVTLYHQAAALVHIYIDGSVLLSHGGCEMGQGINTKMLQVASHELKIPLSYIHQYERTTVTIPNAIVTAGSISTDVNGKAVQNACQILRKRLEPIIKKNSKGKWEDWVAAYEESISLSATGFFKGYVVNMDWEKGEGHAFPYFIFGASCSEVEIDCLTGDHKNLRTDIVIDGSFSINPGIDIGQVEGGFIQGLGLYTSEEIKFSPEGQQYTLGPDTYKIPGLCDIPEDLRTYLLPNSRNPIAIYSSRGLGESGVFLGSSIFFAIRDAVGTARKERGLNSVFTLDSPLNVERIRMACADYFTEMTPNIFPPPSSPVRWQT
uniref:Aldehyde oxidase 1 n=1 Tax=Pseudonaja textilis TaxID=8673 RepID=A0A670XYN9_PSETE